MTERRVDEWEEENERDVEMKLKRGTKKMPRELREG